jgi:hypothetical protein
MVVSLLSPLRQIQAASIGLAGLAGAVVLDRPARAHVEVEADDARAGARDVTVTFTGEAESTTARYVTATSCQ